MSPQQSSGSNAVTAFRVASIKPNVSDREPTVNFPLGPGGAYVLNGGRFSTSNLSLLTYIRFAYKLTDAQSLILESQAPKWVSSDRYDIEAVSDNHNASKDDMRQMMRSLLEDRFELKVHSETRQLPVLALVLAKNSKLGPSIRPHPVDGSPCSTVITHDPYSVVDGKYPHMCGDITNAGVASAPSHVRLGGRDVPISILAARLNGMLMGDLNRPVLDETGLKGTYDFVIEFGRDTSLDANANGSSHTEESGPTLLEALREQLGMKLAPTTGPVEILVVDRIERPSEN